MIFLEYVGSRACLSADFFKDKTLKVAHELPQRFLFMANNVWAKFRIWAAVAT